MKKEQIMRKIQALLNKTMENGATQSEMESALAKASELMEQHHIKEYELNERFEPEKCVLVKVDRFSIAYDTTLFLGELCDLFGTNHFYTKTKVSFYGYKSDVDLCVYFYRVITELISRGIKDYKKSKHYEVSSQFYHGRKLIASWVRGFQCGVSTKMHNLYIERKKEREKQSYGLVLFDKKKKLDEEFNSKFNVKTKISKETEVVSQTYNRGYSKGEEVNIIEAVDNTNSKGNQLMRANQ